jgi:hypothetical protein
LIDHHHHNNTIMSDLHCPCCGTAIDLAVIFRTEADHQALAKLINVGIPLGGKVIDYLTLHTPAHQRLTAAKKIKLILQLLPDLERQQVTAKGRDWIAPHAHWVLAIDQMLANREKLALPLKGHGYLHAILVSMADKAEAATEAKTEHHRRITPSRPTVTVRGQIMGMGEAIEQVYGDRDPALTAIEAHSKQAVPPSAEIRERLAALRRGSTVPPLAGDAP